jgi:hypothetical protein
MVLIAHMRRAAVAVIITTSLTTLCTLVRIESTAPSANRIPLKSFLTDQASTMHRANQQASFPITHLPKSPTNQRCRIGAYSNAGARRAADVKILEQRKRRANLEMVDEVNVPAFKIRKSAEADVEEVD